MAYVRLSIVKPARGREARVAEIMQQLADAAAKQPGCRESFNLKSDDASGELARIAIYSDEAAAAQAANDAHIMALRSELHLAIEPGHSERSFTIV
jgi:quinol monooxygenase YgiN